MDIRKFFQRGLLLIRGREGSSGSDDNDNHDTIGVPQSSKGEGNTGQSSNSPAAPVNIALKKTSKLYYEIPGFRRRITILKRMQAICEENSIMLG
ncbi:hypothetical protein JTB14_020646 [Gonioctena quinquepunctata]|nr:hypothetical protein JTB14_020646 [Gonioctena quinquepunctata]